MPDAVERARAWAAANGIDLSHPGYVNGLRMVAELLKQYGISASDAVKHDILTLGRAMRGEATPAEATAAFLRSYVGPSAGASMMTRQAPNQVRMFIGERSKLWDADAAAKAEKMLAEGADPEDVWRETGTYRGADGKLRQEISDAYDVTDAGEVGASWAKDGLLPFAYDGANPVVTQKQAMNHPELFRAYDDLGRVRIGAVDREGGAYLPELDTIGISRKALKRAARPQSLEDADEAMATNLHELQHAIQRHEGWAQGGSPKQFEISDDLRRNLHSLDDLYRAERLIESAQTRGVRVQDILRVRRPRWASDKSIDLAKFFEGQPRRLQDSIAFVEQVSDPYHSYRRLAGEVEARNTVRRMNMTPAERRLTPPWKTQDIPTEEQIINPL
ncbi:MAG: hypothetical protein D6751_10780 [Deltaproteobacteria bacterium]|nr:MAG: hypothetical protein D6751_10780 [Deltaproteobacteria bacterium]